MCPRSAQARHNDLEDIKKIAFSKEGIEVKPCKQVRDGVQVLLENEINPKALASYSYSDCYHNSQKATVRITIANTHLWETQVSQLYYILS